MSKPRDYLVEPGLIVHVYNRGVNKGMLFREPGFYEIFMQKLMEAKRRAPVSIIAHTLMPTHFHMMLQQHEPFAISAFMQYACYSFSRWTNKRLRRTGPLYDSPYGATPIPDANAFLRILYYILMNPVKAGLVSVADQWKYSSCGALLTGANGSLEDHSLALGLVGGPERLAHFLEEFNGNDPTTTVDYLCEEYARIWEDRTSGEFLRYERESRKLKRFSIKKKRGKRRPG